MDFILKIVELLLGIIPADALTWLKSRRVEYFDKSREALSDDRKGHHNLSLLFYERFCSIHPEEDRCLITQHESWSPQKNDGSFFELHEVTVKESEAPSIEVPKKIKWLPERKKDFANNLLDYQTNRGRRMFNRQAFAFRDYRFGPHDMNPTFEVYQSDYFSFQNTCEVLTHELAHAVYSVFKGLPSNELNLLEESNEKTKRVLDKLILRRKTDLFNFTNRHIGIGVCAMTIFHNYVEEPGGQPESIFLIHQREKTANVSEGIGTISVVPAGTYASVNAKNTAAYDLNLSNTVIREYCEELLGMSEAGDQKTANIIDDRFNRLFSQNYKIYFLGIGMDALNTKCEVMACLVIDLKNYATGRFAHPNPNDEGQPKIKKFDKANLEYYCESEDTMPVARDIFKIVHDNFDFFMSSAIKRTEEELLV